MAEFYKQFQGKLIKLEDTSFIESNKFYRYGSLNKKTYYSEEIPKCNICGGELKFMKKGNSMLILECLNPECETHKCKKQSGDIKLKAFLPKFYYDEILKKREENRHSYYDKNYLINVKGLSEEESEKYIIEHKKIISERKKGQNKEYFEKKYGKEYADKWINTFKQNNLYRKEYWLRQGLNEEESERKISELQKENSKKVKNRKKIDKEYIDKLYGENSSEMFFKQRSIFCKEYWLCQGLSEEESERKISELQKENSKKNKNHNTCLTVKFWENKGFSKEESIYKISNLQKRFSKEICIKKHGKEKGEKIWKDRQIKWQETLHKNGNLHVGFSKISQELFDAILNCYSEEDKKYIYFGIHNHEYVIRKNNANYSYDFTDIKNKKIIEFNGDIYHGNPKMYTSTDKPNPFNEKTCEELWNKDENKKLIANDLGFEELIIWESDYRKNKLEILNECKKFLNI